MSRLRRNRRVIILLGVGWRGFLSFVYMDVDYCNEVLNSLELGYDNPYSSRGKELISNKPDLIISQSQHQSVPESRPGAFRY